MPVNKLNRITRSVSRRFKILRRLLDAMLMMLLLHFWPEQVSRFSTRKLLPPIRDRYPPPENPEIPYEIIESRSSSERPSFDHLNVVLRGSSFDLHELNTLENPIALVSFWPKEMWPNLYPSEFWPPLKTNREVIYTHFHAEAVRELLKLDLRVLWIEGCYSDEQGRFRPQDGASRESWYEELAHHPLCTRISVLQKIHKGGEPFRLRPPTGSGLSAIATCYLLANNISVYGWDYYLKETPLNSSYWSLFIKLYSYFLDSYKGMNFIEAGIINFYYGYKFGNMPGSKIHGYLGQLQAHGKLIEKLERVIFYPKREEKHD